MVAGKIIKGRNTHYITTKLLDLVRKYPDYQIAVLVGQDSCTDELYWTFASNVNVCIDEILDCETEWWDSDIVCTDRMDFQEHAEEKIFLELIEEFGRDPSNEEIAEIWKKVSEAHEPYWKKCIVITADN